MRPGISRSRYRWSSWWNALRYRSAVPGSVVRPMPRSASNESARPTSGIHANAHGESSKRWSSNTSTTSQSNAATAKPVTAPVIAASTMTSWERRANSRKRRVVSPGLTRRPTVVSPVNQAASAGSAAASPKRVQRVHGGGTLTGGDVGDDRRDLLAPAGGDRVDQPTSLRREADRHLAPVGGRLAPLHQSLRRPADRTAG